MPEPGTALVSFGAGTWTLREGRLLAYGREADRHIQIPDPRVSARAGLLFIRSGCVWVRHDSFSHGLVIVGSDARPQVVPRRRPGRPGQTRLLLGAVCELELVGRVGALRIRVRQLPDVGPALPGSEAPPGDERTESLRAELTVDERRLLAALCEGMLRSGGVGEPALTREVADRLGITRKAAENRLTRLRSKLSSLGVDGLLGVGLGIGAEADVGASGQAANHPAASYPATNYPATNYPAANYPATNYVARLGWLAYANGWVLDEDLELLNRR